MFKEDDIEDMKKGKTLKTFNLIKPLKKDKKNGNMSIETTPSKDFKSFKTKK